MFKELADYILLGCAYLNAPNLPRDKEFMLSILSAAVYIRPNMSIDFTSPYVVPPHDPPYTSWPNGDGTRTWEPFGSFGGNYSIHN